jgi:hypothetical protein
MMTLLVDVVKISPARDREYRTDTATTAFWRVNVIRLMYFHTVGLNSPLPPAPAERNQINATYSYYQPRYQIVQIYLPVSLPSYQPKRLNKRRNDESFLLALSLLRQITKMEIISKSNIWFLKDLLPRQMKDFHWQDNWQSPIHFLGMLYRSRIIISSHFKSQFKEEECAYAQDCSLHAE